MTQQEYQQLNSTRKTQVLVVEDESSIADTVCYALEYENFATKWCETALDAEKYLENNEIDFIILDVGLPDVNGFEFCRELRKKVQTPILFLTARNDEIDRIIGLEIGGDDYMTKPFSPRELVARVKAILRRFSLTQQPCSEVKITKSVVSEDENNLRDDDSIDILLQINENFAMNEDLRQIFCCENLLKLSRYEYELLAILLKNPRRIYSRRQLMQMVWEEPDASTQRTVDTHIKTLRQKIKDVLGEDGNELIITHRGFGYSGDF